MREISVVISWMDPRLVADLFLGMRQLGWAAPAPTSLLREALPQYPVAALTADCDTLNSKLLSRCRPSDDVELDEAAWEKSEEELQANMILGPFSYFNDVSFLTVRLLRRLVVHRNNTVAHRNQLCG